MRVSARIFIECAFVYAILSFFQISLYLNTSKFTIKSDHTLPHLKEDQHKKNLIVINTIGKRNNLVLMEHARRNIFSRDKWDCIAFMISNEEEVPNDDPYLRALQDELKCSVPRTPFLHWGDLLHFITPTLVSNYNYVGLLLDDIFIPHEGEKAFKPDVLLERMKRYNIGSIQPSVENDTLGTIKTSRMRGLDECLAMSSIIETYLQFFTPEAWQCYYSNLHHKGSKGWCYDVCFKKNCPRFILAQDFTMKVFHMDRKTERLPYHDKSVVVPANMEWKPGEPLQSNYKDLDYFATCESCGFNVNQIIYPPDILRLTKVYCYNN